MDTRNKEQISAFADGELAGPEADVALAALRGAEGRGAWEAYHQVGDVLRSEDMAVRLSEDFNARLFARLDEEPAIVAPANLDRAAERKNPKRFLLPGFAAAAAAATLTFIAAPQLMVASGVPAQNAEVKVASATTPVPAPKQEEVAAPQQLEVVRDPSIDEYLVAHQRFSPSVYSAAQYARSATFATSNDK